jgi:hypothetical protein
MLKNEEVILKKASKVMKLEDIYCHVGVDLYQRAVGIAERALHIKA